MCLTQQKRAGSKQRVISPQLELAIVQKTKGLTTTTQHTIDIKYAIFPN